MWVCKLLFYPSKDSLFAPKIMKYNLTFLGYPLNYFKKNKKDCYCGAGLLIGDEKNKKDFIKDLKKDKRVLKLERNGDYFLGTYLQMSRLKQLYDPELIRYKPVIIDSKGNEIWEMASFDQESLKRFVNHAKENYKDIRLLKFSKKKNITLSILNIVPQLTNKQKEALNLAIENGYYEYPRKIELEKLAKLMKISYSTYQAHLRKAENKLIPSQFEKVK